MYFVLGGVLGGVLYGVLYGVLLTAERVLSRPRPFGEFHLGGAIVWLTMQGNSTVGQHGARQEMMVPGRLEQRFYLSVYQHLRRTPPVGQHVWG